jgi:formate/nitrite transporter FocA (FNT family)
MTKFQMLSGYLFSKVPVSKILAGLFLGLGFIFIYSGYAYSSQTPRTSNILGSDSIDRLIYSQYCTNMILFGCGLVLISIFFAVFAALKKAINVYLDN